MEECCVCGANVEEVIKIFTREDAFKHFDANFRKDNELDRLYVEYCKMELKILIMDSYFSHSRMCFVCYSNFMPFCHQPDWGDIKAFSGQYMYYGVQHKPDCSWKANDIISVSWEPRDTICCYTPTDNSKQMTEKWAYYACIVFLKNREFIPFLPMPKDQEEINAIVSMKEQLLEITSVPFIKIGVDRMKRQFHVGSTSVPVCVPIDCQEEQHHD